MDTGYIHISTILCRLLPMNALRNTLGGAFSSTFFPAKRGAIRFLACPGRRDMMIFVPGSEQSTPDAQKRFATRLGNARASVPPTPKMLRTPGQPRDTRFHAILMDFCALFIIFRSFSLLFRCFSTVLRIDMNLPQPIWVSIDAAV